VVVHIKMTQPRNKQPRINLRDVDLVAQFLELKESMAFELYSEKTPALHDMQGQSFFTGKIVRLQTDTVTEDSIISTCTAEFNTECRGWHYSWTGSRFKTYVSHVFAVHVFPPAYTHNSLRSVTFRSPPFMIASLRRKGGLAFQEIRDAQALEYAAKESYCSDVSTSVSDEDEKGYASVSSSGYKRE
jgi:hypothetical protein